MQRSTLVKTPKEEAYAAHYLCDLFYLVALEVFRALHIIFDHFFRAYAVLLVPLVSFTTGFLDNGCMLHFGGLRYSLFFVELKL